MTLTASTTVTSLDGALVREKLAGVTPDIGRLAQGAEVATLALTEKEEPRLQKLARRLEKLSFAPVGPTAVVSGGTLLELWVDNSSGDSIFVSTVLASEDVEQWFADVRTLVLEYVAAEPREASKKDVAP
jgi:hypothetical protein